MKEDLQSCFEHIWVFDFEYVADDGEAPEPVCVVAIDLVTGAKVRLWLNEMRAKCPFSTDSRSLFVCFAGIGDFACFIDLGWPLPERVVDLYPECKQLVFDSPTGSRMSLLRAAQYFGVAAMESETKDAARDLIIARKFNDADREYLLDYCEADVHLTASVFRAIEDTLIESGRSWCGVLMRGRYTMALAQIEIYGSPVDSELMNRAQSSWSDIQQRLISEIDKQYGVYIDGKWSNKAFEHYLSAAQIPWPRLDSGQLDLKDSTFRSRAAAYPEIQNLRELRTTLSKTRLFSFPIGKDGRNRTYLNPYGSVTGRNQPSGNKFIFGSARWTRSFIVARPGWAIVYADWASQEIAVNAALSGDEALWRTYTSGDPYLGFAIEAGLAPVCATKSTHGELRKRVKAIVLGVGYGMGAESMAQSAGIHIGDAKELLQRHREVYRKFWDYVERVQDMGSLGETLRTVFDWKRRIKPGCTNVNRRSFQNWPAQANAADMMRLAACLLIENGILVCAPVHDAFLCEVPLSVLDEQIELIQKLMGDASEVVLGDGYRVRTDIEVFDHPNRYVDENAGDLFDRLIALLKEVS